ncbi:MAG: Fe(3+) ABC transporter substrate-binding protein [Hansschlegelia sp.]
MSARRSLSIIILAATLAPAAVSAAEVNLYTTREPKLIQPLLDAYTAKSGAKVNTVFVKDGLVERVTAEGRNSPADLLMTVDFGALIDVVDKGLGQPIQSETLKSSIPAALRDPDGQWYALSMRARVAYVAKEESAEAKGLTYESLGDPKWKGKICIRSGKHPYNTALLAAFIARDGAEAAKSWLTSVKTNLARKPTGGDRDGAKDIAAGICDVAIGNSYYVGLMRSGKGGPDQQKWADAMEVALPVFAKGGTHVNVSGAVVAKYAPNKDEAVRLLEYLVSDEAQGIYARGNFEYPVKPGAPIDPILAAFGPLKIDDLPLAAISAKRKEAAALIDEVAFDD